MKPDPLKEGKRWLLQAEQDLKDAEYSFDGKRFHLVCFLSRQAAEKALKAFLYVKRKYLAILLQNLVGRSSSR